MKSKGTAAVLAFFLGGFGVHKFYLNQGGKGVLYLLFCWTYIPSLIAFVEAIMLLTMSEHDFNQRFNSGYVAFNTPAPIQNAVSSNNTNAQNITINVPSGAGAAPATMGVAEQIKQLHDLHIAGALTQEEFQFEKQRVLTSGQKLLR